MTAKRPNFLIIQADQLAARALAAYGNTVSKTPAIDRLADRGVVFENAYCNYPLCGPSRTSMMSGLLPFKAGAFDNGSEFAASIPTFAHYLGILGYQTCLSGKMHFVGPDQLHGFDERLTTDIYPSDFNWSANWSRGDDGNAQGRLLAAAGEAKGILRSGIYERTIQIDYDDEVCFKAVRKIYDYARADDRRAFCLVASFTHPHDPFAVPREYWDRYRHDDIDMPLIPRQPRGALDAHSQRLFDHIGVAEADLSDEAVRIARHAYYAAASYVDDQVATLVTALDTAGLADNTVVIFLADHGEALGERGLWFKRSFYDVALRVPFIVSLPWCDRPIRPKANVSLIDLLPTLVDLADPKGGMDIIEAAHDGRSLRKAIEGGTLNGPDIVFAEMAADALTAPAVAVIDGDHKYIHCETDPPLLFDRASDPMEVNNLCGSPAVTRIEAHLSEIVATQWDLLRVKTQVLESQRCRRLIDRAHAVGVSPSWDYDVVQPGRTQYFRPCPENPSASNYNSDFNIRSRPDAETPNKPVFP